MPRHLIRNSVLALVVVICLFEVGIRLAPPDEMVITRHVYESPNHYATISYDAKSPQDQSSVAAWYSALNNSPIEGSSVFIQCNGIGFDSTTIQFNWHGIPVQSWMSGPCPGLTVSSGGIWEIWETRPFDLSHPPTQLP